LRRTLITGLTGLALLAFAAPAASASTRISANWSGYAARRSGVKFHRISGSWTQPSATCTPGHKTYSAFWVGLGGYNVNSSSLEQIGTEVDCTASGAVRSTAWYELVPAGSRAIHLQVQPGDAMSASVVVVGHTVTVELSDVTRHRSFVKTLHARTVDVTSAEWIAEAPSECIPDGACVALPLTNFGIAAFNFAQAKTTTGRVGSISSSAWAFTKLRLLPGGRHYVVATNGGVPVGESKPSDLSANGSQFSVSYSEIQLKGNPFLGPRQASVRDGHLVR
jgi:Peptidase A4 family